MTRAGHATRHLLNPGPYWLMGREMDERIPSKLCGRPFDEADVERIRREIVAAHPPQRSEIARRVCRALDWADVLGRPKLMSAQVGLLRLHRAGLIALPPPSGGAVMVGDWCRPRRVGRSRRLLQARSVHCTDCGWKRSSSRTLRACGAV